MGIRIQNGIDASGILQYEVILDRDYYHIHNEIIEWCKEQYGYGSGYSNRWHWSELFGHTFITFYTEKDRNWFLLKWANDNGIH